MGAASSLVSLHRVDERSTHTRCCVQSTMAHAMPPSVVARLRAMPGNKVRWRRRACRAGVHAGPSHPVSAMLWRVCLPWSAMRRLPGQQSAVGERFVRRVALPGVLWQAPWPGRTHQLRALGANGLVVCEADQDDGGVCVWWRRLHNRTTRAALTWAHMGRLAATASFANGSRSTGCWTCPPLTSTTRPRPSCTASGASRRSFMATPALIPLTVLRCWWCAGSWPCVRAASHPQS